MTNSDFHRSAESTEVADPYAMTVNNLRRRAIAVYLACEGSVADDISAALKWSADEIDRLSAPAQAERVWHRKDCPFCGSPDGQYSGGSRGQEAAFFCKGCGINAAQPPAAPVETIAGANDKELGKHLGAYLGMSGIDAEDVAHIRAMLSPAQCSAGRESEIADEIDSNLRIGADHRFSDEEARIIQKSLRAVPQGVRK